MTTRELTFFTMDAGEQREFLAEQLADWIEAEFWSDAAARAFYRRVKILARRVGMPFVEVMDDLRGEADEVVAFRTRVRGSEAAR